MTNGSINNTRRSFSIHEGETSNFDLACKVCILYIVNISYMI